MKLKPLIGIFAFMSLLDAAIYGACMGDWRLALMFTFGNASALSCVSLVSNWKSK